MASTTIPVLHGGSFISIDEYPEELVDKEIRLLAGIISLAESEGFTGACSPVAESSPVLWHRPPFHRRVRFRQPATLPFPVDRSWWQAVWDSGKRPKFACFFY
ncbi:MAG: hypothetical protein JXD19_02350 [Deltaproteobacteria bacterium]|nr:hypothetical protein [Deltaproteobacteria bacterium]